MYQNTSTEFNNIIAGDGRTFLARMVCGDEILTRFMSVKLTSQANEDTNTISIGGAVSSFIEVNMEKSDVLITGKEYSLEMGLMVGEAVEWIPMGVFTPQKPKESDGMVTFTAYDRMVSKLSDAYFTDITNYPVDGKVILQEIATKTGIPLGNLDDLPNGIMVPMRMQTGDEGTTTAKPFDGYTYREAVKYLAQMYGKFATFNRDGELEFLWYAESRFNTNRLYAEPESSESVYTLQKITCTVGENTLTSGSGTTGISIENPVMTQEILDNVFAKICGMEYLPTTCSFFGDIRLDLGDIVTVQGRTGIERKIPVMSLSVDFDGGIITDIGSYGNTEEEENQTKGPTATALDRVYTDLFLVREVLANKVSTDTLEANYVTIKQLDAVSARIDKITSTEITTEYLEANYTKTKDLEAKYAVIDLSNVKVESVQDLFVNVGLIKDATIVNGHITGYLDAVSINAESIKAGTLSVDRLVLNGTEDSLIFALNNIGELTSAHCDTLDGGLITERTITAEHIVAGAITANEIASETITADKVNIANLTAEVAKVIELDAGRITSGYIDASMVKADSLEAIVAKIGGFTIGSSAIYNGTNSMTSTTAGIYVGTGGIRQYKDANNYVNIQNGKLTCIGADIKGNMTIKGNLYMVCSSYSETSYPAIKRYQKNDYVMTEFCGYNGEVLWSHNSEGVGVETKMSVFTSGEFYEGGKALSSKYQAKGSYLPLSGGTITGTLVLSKTTDLSGTANKSPALIVGGAVTAAHLEFDANEIHAKSNGTSVNGLIINGDGGDVTIGDSANKYTTTVRNDLYVESSITAEDGLSIDNSYLYIDYSNYIESTVKGGEPIDLIGVNSVNNIHMGDYNGGNISPVYLHAKGTQYNFVAGYFGANTSNSVALGASSKLWTTVYAKTGTINTSDRTKKHDINDLSDIYEKLFMKLQPKSFIFNDGDRVHIGAISQDVEEIMNELGIVPEKFAGFCKDIRYDYTEYNEEDGTPVESSKVPCKDEGGNIIYDYALRYQEFIFLTIHMVQKLWKRVDILEKENAELKQQNETLAT